MSTVCELLDKHVPRVFRILAGVPPPLGVIQLGAAGRTCATKVASRELLSVERSPGIPSRAPPQAAGRGIRRAEVPRQVRQMRSRQGGTRGVVVWSQGLGDRSPEDIFGPRPLAKARSNRAPTSNAPFIFACRGVRPPPARLRRPLDPCLGEV